MHLPVDPVTIPLTEDQLRHIRSHITDPNGGDGLRVPSDGTVITLTGDEIKYIRNVLGEAQHEFARRLAITQASVHRFERKGSEEMTGPEIILISLIAAQHGVPVSEHGPRSRPERAVA